MSILREPGLGPLIGHTTATTCRIWMRAEDPSDNKANLDEDRRTMGVIGVVENGAVTRAHYFRLPREYDRTGVFDLGKDVDLGQHKLDREMQPNAGIVPQKPTPLKPNTEYSVYCASLTIDDPFPNAASLTDFDLSKYLPPIDQIKNELLRLDATKAQATFRTQAADAPAAPAAKLSFLLGSCRYPGLLWKIKEADRIFGPMCDQLQPRLDQTNAAFSLMVGDQIYGDELNRFIPILRAENYAEFQQRYIEAFGAPNMRRLLAMAPSYMILDDHEIEDNWSQDRVKKSTSSAHLFNTAISAYMNYQWSHSPRNYGRMFYYDFEYEGYPFFVLDTRTQRFKDDADVENNHLLGLPTQNKALYPSQLDRLLDWLTAQNAKGNHPKFIVSTSVFVPNSMDERTDKESTNRKLLDSDSWPAFPQTRRRILKHIVDNKIQNVIFLSGDIHCSNVAAMTFSGSVAAKKLRAFSITSSAFYWPFPFADGDPNGYVHDSTRAGQKDTFDIDGTNKMNYRAWGFTQDDNFCRIDIDAADGSITVRAYDNKGRGITVGSEDGAPTVGTKLELAAW